MIIWDEFPNGPDGWLGVLLIRAFPQATGQMAGRRYFPYNSLLLFLLRFQSTRVPGRTLVLMARTSWLRK